MGLVLMRLVKLSSVLIGLELISLGIIDLLPIRGVLIDCVSREEKSIFYRSVKNFNNFGNI